MGFAQPGYRPYNDFHICDLSEPMIQDLYRRNPSFKQDHLGSLIPSLSAPCPLAGDGYSSATSNVSGGHTMTLMRLVCMSYGLLRADVVGWFCVSRFR